MNKETRLFIWGFFQFLVGVGALYGMYESMWVNGNLIWYNWVLAIIFVVVTQEGYFDIKKSIK